MLTVVIWAFNVTVTKYILGEGFQPVRSRPLKREIHSSAGLAAEGSAAAGGSSAALIAPAEKAAADTRSAAKHRIAKDDMSVFSARRENRAEAYSNAPCEPRVNRSATGQGSRQVPAKLVE